MIDSENYFIKTTSLQKLKIKIPGTFSKKYEELKSNGLSNRKDIGS